MESGGRGTTGKKREKKRRGKKKSSTKSVMSTSHQLMFLPSIPSRIFFSPLSLSTCLATVRFSM